MTAPTLTPADRELLATLPLTVAALVAHGDIPIDHIRDVRAAAVREALEGCAPGCRLHGGHYAPSQCIADDVWMTDERLARRAALRGSVDAAGGDGGAA